MSRARATRPVVRPTPATVDLTTPITVAGPFPVSPIGRAVATPFRRSAPRFDCSYRLLTQYTCQKPTQRALLLWKSKLLIAKDLLLRPESAGVSTVRRYFTAVGRSRGAPCSIRRSRKLRYVRYVLYATFPGTLLEFSRALLHRRKN